MQTFRYVVMYINFCWALLCSLRNLSIAVVVSSLSATLYDIVNIIFFGKTNKNNACYKRNLICLK